MVGMKYPIGVQSFEIIRSSGYVYVDKTDLVYSLTHEGRVYFLGRPRRFGKSLLISTLKNYYLGKKELFKGLAIEQLETEWKVYPVFHVDFGQGSFVEAGNLDEVLDSYLSTWERQYGLSPFSYPSNYSLRFTRLLEAVHQQTGLRAAVLIDEYDKPLLDVMDTDFMVEVSGKKITLEEYNRERLKAFYGTFKAADDHLQFVMLTGVTKFSQVSVFSGFNQPDDISMTTQYDSLCGITEEEISKYFAQPVQEMAEVYGCTPVEMREMLRRRFDGYHFSKRMKGVYNPFSLLNTLKKQDIQDYWFGTGTPTYLVRLMNHFDETINDLSGRYYAPSQFVDYRADKEMPLPMIFQSGYLTIKDYKQRTNQFLLDFPNDEVKKGFVTLLAGNYLKPKESVDNWVLDAVNALDEGDLEMFHMGLSSFLSSIPYTMRRKDTEREKERFFHYTFYLLLRLLSTYMVYTEKVQSQGRVDSVVETPQYVYIFEFKLDGSADEALRQIEDKGYAREYANDGRRLYKIGCSFSSATGTISDWKVEA